MSELLFVGMGLYDEKDLSTRAIEELRRVGLLLCEQYTSRLAEGSLARLQAMIGKDITELSREELEAEKMILDALDRGQSVALLVPGEALAATTHQSLRMSAEKRGHSTRILHGASILTAAASLAGLSHYKFGRVVSLPYPVEGESYRPVSPYDSMAANHRSGLHTLILLDLDPSRQRYLTADRALRHLGILEDELKAGIATPSSLFIVVARAGAPDSEVFAGERKFLETLDFRAPLHSVILPGPTLHFVEDEAIQYWRERTEGRARER